MRRRYQATVYDLPRQDPGRPPPKPLSAQAGQFGGVEVTLALRGLRRAVVTVPGHGFRSADLAALAAAVSRSVEQLLAQDVVAAGRVPDTGDESA